MTRRLLAISLSLLLGFGFTAFRKRNSLQRSTIPAAERIVAEWNGYEYHHSTHTQFSVEGRVAAISPNGGAFCSGPFAGGPGTSFVIEVGSGRRGVGVALAAFGTDEAAAGLRALQVGSRVRLTGTEGPVIITRDGVEVQRVEDTGHWWTSDRQYVVVVDAVAPAT